MPNKSNKSKQYAPCLGSHHHPGICLDLEGGVNDAQDWSAEQAVRGFEACFMLSHDASLLS